MPRSCWLSVLLSSIALQVGNADIRCATPHCTGKVAAIGTADNFFYNPEKNNLHHDLTGANILVIGDSRGIGNALVRRMVNLVGSTGRVLGASRTPPELLEPNLKELHDNDPRYKHIIFDAGDTPRYNYTTDYTAEFTQIVEELELGDNYERLLDEVKPGGFLNGRIDHIYHGAAALAPANIADIPWAHFKARREADISDHAVWDTVKQYMNRDYGTMIGVSSLDARVHFDIAIPGYGSAKQYKTQWYLDMHASTRDHPLYKNLRFVSIEPVYVNTSLAVPNFVIIPPKEELVCEAVVNRTLLIGQALLNSEFLLPISPLETADVCWEIMTRKDIGKPFHDKNGGPVPTRISIHNGRGRSAGFGQIPYLLSEGGPMGLNLDHLYRNQFYSTITELPGAEWGAGLYLLRCEDKEIDKLIAEFGVSPEAVQEQTSRPEEIEKEPSVLGAALVDFIVAERMKMIHWLAATGKPTPSTEQEKKWMEALGLTDEEVISGLSFAAGLSAATLEDLNLKLLPYGAGIGPADDAGGDTPRNNQDAKLIPSLRDIKFAKQEPIVAKRPIPGQYNPYEKTTDPKERFGNLGTLSVPPSLLNIPERFFTFDGLKKEPGTPNPDPFAVPDPPKSD
uniref:Uncharacterized protein n=1 Tax=Chromera velia CCMP2878 TaxID=1169474 RepID=A0A0G4IDL7_9ALVE|eukprot:Cvel_2353.t1-p1 / transcript=Cvel_2353.t1 / gene=Cvel_2353 / organism=Chromera_velia_CCMP2878 / gene_product=hypothetical protein / transcript_product=hypothetical protein / location=Cvel_scaffold91:48251-51910(-) / protein_length=622 / sequence_SO=supercontig / SO=protein_coding / is_pseudo=false